TYPKRPPVPLRATGQRAKGRGAADWYFVRDAVRITGHYEGLRRKEEEERTAAKEWDREQEARRRAEDPKVKAAKQEAEIAALRAEVDRLTGGTAGAGRGAP